MKTITLQAGDDLLREPEREARERGQSKSVIVRAALEQFLNRARAARPGSALAAARPWVGWVKAPNLSTNPIYLEGFGT
jgi:hypothetical protein